ncbi:uncharacterized protein RCO7_15212 [Rhynchosporium graminicola]|uniref:Uncharacterized protein n=1 Tax=Rhynchosporium graminicola TaxID=2792576 RepID=A0A1E1LR38_9HELO|nr:uncharacterized protein RCO7_15212 [Rhynchosporium commune]
MTRSTSRGRVFRNGGDRPWTRKADGFYTTLDHNMMTTASNVSLNASLEKNGHLTTPITRSNSIKTRTISSDSCLQKRLIKPYPQLSLAVANKANFTIEILSLHPCSQGYLVAKTARPGILRINKALAPTARPPRSGHPLSLRLQVNLDTV